MQILVIGLLNSPAFVFIFTALTLLSEPGYTGIIRPNNQLQTDKSRVILRYLKKFSDDLSSWTRKE
ncbi:unnamed protein product [Larinioides sclopetarius]|uniref:Uncharacterized protein n=1 Tax=Larinioides sclopetarius TaxID=280406 RepID=A0AAV2BJP3_9ARAC